MRELLALVLAMLLLVPDLPARTKHDWTAVENLTPETFVTISLWNGDVFSGRVISVSDSGLRIETQQRRVRATTSPLHDIERKDIRKITRLPEPHLPNPEKWMAIGALAGAGAGVTVGAVRDIREGASGQWLVGGLAGAALGFFGACTVLAAVGIGKAVPVLVHHHKLIYEGSAPPVSN